MKKYLENCKKIRVWVDNDDFGEYQWNGTRFQGWFGYLPLEAVVRCLAGDEKYNHLKIEIED